MANVNDAGRSNEVEYVRMFDNGGLLGKDKSMNFRNVSSNTEPVAADRSGESYVAE